MDQRTDPGLMDAQTLLACLRDDRTGGNFQVARRIFSDPAIFELEMKHVFGGTWVYVAHASQVPSANDYLTTRIGRTPVIVMRGEDGQIRTVLNTCRHRGAQVISDRRGNKKALMCPYHGWVYDSTGRCVQVDAEARGGYPQAFRSQSHDLVAVRTESYRGFVFASLNPDVPPLREHLAGAGQLIADMADQSPEGLELVGGVIRYTCAANWKMQLENIDGYHFFPVHASYIGLIAARQQKGGADKIKAIDATQMGKLPGGAYDLGNGHIVDWAMMPNGDDRPLGFQRARIEREFGKARSAWMIDAVRNLAVFPNMLLMDQSSSTIRVVRPVRVDLTELEVYCVAPKGEPAAARERRIRQFEDFLGPAGMATPDDQAVMEACQRGFAADEPEWLQGHYRGIERLRPGADEHARTLGLQPLESASDIDDETFAHAQYREWLKLMTAGV
jgi:benzoate/toluate 1,2-dioxygenase subunit alpha